MLGRYHNIHGPPLPIPPGNTALTSEQISGLEQDLATSFETSMNELLERLNNRERGTSNMEEIENNEGSNEPNTDQNETNGETNGSTIPSDNQEEVHPLNALGIIMERLNREQEEEELRTTLLRSIEER